jgi:hypothetical protein
MHICFENPQAIPKFEAPKGLHKTMFILRTYSSKMTAILTVIWFFLLRPYKLVHISLCSEKTAVIMQKMLGFTVQNLVTWVTKCLGIMHPGTRLCF